MKSNIRKQAPLIAFLLSLPVVLQAQPGTRYATSQLDGYVVPKQHVRADDVLWMKTVWQRIDLREKNNQSLYFPGDESQHRSSLFNLIVQSVYKEPTVPAYDLGALGLNDMFNDPLSRSELADILIQRDTVRSESLFEDGVYENVVIEEPLSSESIIAYDIKEHWFIDRNRGVLESRIVGICPVAVVLDENGGYKGTKRLFWLYYPELEHQMVGWSAYNRHNDLETMSYARYFDEHRFTGRITKISNVQDRTMASYLAPEDALLKGIDTKEYLRNLELDLWNY